MDISAKELFDENKSNTGLIEILGDINILKISPIEKVSQGSLVFCDNKNYLKFLENSKQICVITNKDLFEKIKQLSIECIIISENVAVSHAKIKQKYMDYKIPEDEWGKIHKTVIIHETTDIPDTTQIGPNTIIGRNVKLGKNVYIGPNCIIEENAIIGNDVIIHANTVIGHDCIIGNRVLIKYGSILGGEGFGFVPDSKKTYHRLPQTGIVVIEDDVVLGSNNCIDRAAYGETRIKRGTKFDNFVHIAHNVVIGEDVILTAGCIIAGSTTIGNRVIMSGQTGVLDHLKITDDVILVQRAGIASDIKEPGIYAGIPHQPLTDYLKNSAIFKKLTELKTQVNQIEKFIKNLKKD